MKINRNTIHEITKKMVLDSRNNRKRYDDKSKPKKWMDV